MRLIVSIAIILFVGYLDYHDVIPAWTIPWQVASLSLYMGLRALYAAYLGMVNDSDSMWPVAGMVAILPWGLAWTVFGIAGFLSLFGII